MSEEQIIATAGGTSNIPPHPEGPHPATCIDIVDHGMVELTWQGKTKTKHRIQLRFFCGEYFEDDDGNQRPLWVDAYFTLSLHEKATLRKFLQNWRGKAFTEDELKGFNIAKLLGAPGLVQVSHNTTPARTYANVDSIMKLPKGMTAPDAPEGYVRVKDRPKDDGPDSTTPYSNKAPWAAGAAGDDDLDDLPF